MEAPDSIRHILNKNYFDKFNFRLQKETYFNKLKKSYSKYDYPMTDSLLEKLVPFFYIKKLSPEAESSDGLYFDVKTITCFRQSSLDWYAEKFNVSKVIYLGDTSHIRVWIDEKEKIWGDYDNLVVFYGNNLYEGIENILNHRCEVISR